MGHPYEMARNLPAARFYVIWSDKIKINGRKREENFP